MPSGRRVAWALRSAIYVDCIDFNSKWFAHFAIAIAIRITGNIDLSRQFVLIRHGLTYLLPGTWYLIPGTYICCNRRKG